MKFGKKLKKHQKKFDSEPVYNKKYLKAKVNSYKGKINMKNMNMLIVIIMSRTSFRVNLHSIVCLNVKEFLAQSRHHI